MKHSRSQDRASQDVWAAKVTLLLAGTRVMPNGQVPGFHPGFEGSIPSARSIGPVLLGRPTIATRREVGSIPIWSLFALVV